MQENSHIRWQKGYTLLELILVLAIIAMITTFAMKMYGDATNSNRINKAALEMQHIMEAGLAYNVANGFWPIDNSYSNSGSQTDCQTVADSTFKTTYLPNQTNLSSYGAYFCWSGGNDGIQDPPPDYERFWVSLKFPGTYLQTAQRIAALLPNAVATSDQPQPFVVNATPAVLTNTPCSTSLPCYVRAEVPLPGMDEKTSSMVGMGYCMPHDPLDHTIDTATCKSGICHFATQPGAPSSITCWQLTAQQEDVPGNKTDVDAQYRLNYIVTFSCPANLNPTLIVSPNFLTLPRYDATDADPNDANGYYDYPLYKAELGRATSSNGGLYGDQLKLSCSTKVCQFVMNGAIGGRKSNSPPGPGVLVTHYGSGPFRKGGDGLPEYPGAIGASYIALCVPPPHPNPAPHFVLPRSGGEGGI